MSVKPSRREGTMRAFAFEDLVAQLFSKLGYSVNQSARIGRAEIDLLVERGGQRFPVEVSVVPPHSAMMKLRTDAERLRSLLDTVEGMSKPIIVVGSDLTPEAKAWSEAQWDVSVWDSRELARQAAGFPDIAKKLRELLGDDVRPSPAVDTESEALRARLRAHIDGDDISDSEYEALCMEVFTTLFDPYLYGFERQVRTTDGGNRYDFICRIKSGNHFWDSLRQDFRTKAILFECKNYSEKIGPDQVYSTERYLFSGALRTVCLLIARLGPNDAAIRAAQGAMRESGKLIILLSDEDLIEMLKLSSQEGGAEDFLDKRIWDFIIGLPR